MALPRGYHEWQQHVPERRFAETVWTYHAAGAREHLVLPDGRMDIILKFTSASDGACHEVLPVIAGPTNRPEIVEFQPNVGFVGVRLLPGRAGGFGYSAAALRSQLFFGEDALKVLPNLSGLPSVAANPDVLVKSLEDWIIKNAAPPGVHAARALGTALDRLHLAAGRASIAGIAVTAGLSERQLHRLFLRWVGLTPKEFADVLRFHRSLRLMLAGLTASAAAHEAGYSDQSHMTRAFQRLGGFTPRRMPQLDLAGFRLGN